MFRYLVLLSFISSLSFAQQKNPEKIDAEQYFENLSAEERREYVDRAEVINHEYKQNPSADVLEELSNTCNFDYKRDAKGRPVLPVVECEYKPTKPDNPLDGMTAKFNCDFLNDKNKKKKRKVKYSLKEVDQKELPQAVVTASLMRLMGFYAETYCPAIVRCKGCSQDPWQHKGQAPAVPGAVVEFKNAVVEFKVKGEKISVPRTPAHPKPLGFEWTELKTTSKQYSPQDQRDLLIERETLMILNNFVYHTDADPHNNRLVCMEWEDTANGYKCTRPIAFTHDVGDSFKRMSLGFYQGYDPLLSGSGWFSKGESCQGGLDRGEGIIVNARYSNESRNLFLQRFELVGDQQILDLMELAQVKKMGTTPQAWLKALRDNANSMRPIKCPAFDAGQSVMSKK